MKPLLLLILTLLILSCGTDTAEVCCEVKVETNGWHDETHVEISPDGYIHERGTKITLEAFADSNTAFYEWGGDISSFQNPYTFIVTENVNIMAKFGTDHISFSVGKVGGGTISEKVLNPELGEPESPDYRMHGSKLELTATSNETWQFIGWQIYQENLGLSVKVKNPLQHTVRSNGQIVANFVLAENQGRFNVFGGSVDINVVESGTVTSDDGYLVTGMVGKHPPAPGLFTETTYSYGRCFIAKHNSDGTREWIKFIGDEGTDYIGRSIIESSNGNIVLTGNLTDVPNVNIMMLSPTGTKRWVKSYGATEGDYGTDIIEADGGFVLTGSSSSIHPEFKRGANYILIMKTDKEGNLKWVNTYGGSNTEVGKSIIQAGGEGYLVGGYSNSNDGELTGLNKGNNDIVILKYSLEGDLVWDKTIGGSADDVLLSMVETSDKSYVITGFTESSDGDFNGMNKGQQDIFAIKLDSKGDIIWKKTFGGTLDERATSITEGRDGSLALTGYSRSGDGDFNNLNRGHEDIVLIELSKNGSTEFITTFGGSGKDYGNSIALPSNGRYIIAGDAGSSNGDFMMGGYGYFVLTWY